MMRRSVFICGMLLVASASLPAAELPHTWYRRAPVQLNGQDVPGRWYYRDGDVITTDGRNLKQNSTAKLDYTDSSSVYTSAYSTVVVHHRWLDVPVGGLALNLVSGTPHITQAETPLGIFRFHGTSGDFFVHPPADGAWEVVVAVTAGEIEWQLEFGAAAKLPRTAAWIDAGDKSRFEGRVRIHFDRARRVKLSPTEWNDQVHTRAACRNLIVDLLENDDHPSVPREVSMRYDLSVEL